MYVITPDEHLTVLDLLFAVPDDLEESEQQRFFGTFTLNGDTPRWGKSWKCTAGKSASTGSMTLAQYIDRQLRPPSK